MPFLATDQALWDKIIRINLYGALNLHHAVCPGMVAAGGGRVVNIASDAARVGTSGEANSSGGSATGAATAGATGTASGASATGAATAGATGTASGGGTMGSGTGTTSGGTGTTGSASGHRFAISAGGACL